MTQPMECESALNLTGSDRLDHNGQNLGRRCDARDMVRNGRPWFRFSGDAGRKMLNRCPPESSCGTTAGMWTDSLMPADVGVESVVEVFASYNRKCKWHVYQMAVVRCSSGNNYDFIYKYMGEDICKLGFCGMNVN